VRLSDQSDAQPGVRADAPVRGFYLANGSAARRSTSSLGVAIHYRRVFLKIIGLIGGMSWESTVPYYRQINETIKHRLGGLHSAKIVLYSVDFYDVERLQHAGDWEAAGAMLADAARSLEAAGSDFLVLCTNTMHKVASTIEAAVTIPLFHIADPTATEIKRAGHSTVGLLGTRFTMEQAFYRDRLSERHGLQVIVPNAEDRDIVHRIIYEELCLGVVLPESRSEYRRVMESLASQGAEAIILGCTEISLLVSQKDSRVPLFDTTAIHARAAAEEALSQ
jgi:aspartate racemase